MADQEQLSLPTDECNLEGCTERFAQKWDGRNRLYCSDRCRQQASRDRRHVTEDRRGHGGES